MIEIRLEDGSRHQFSSFGDAYEWLHKYGATDNGGSQVMPFYTMFEIYRDGTRCVVDRHSR